ncbi:MAG: hypothetical protein IPM51_14655 [Sphingobacteriaceae bacterium]|nr:hypothetical protein [Sphingobacteriaceae bacterium]
MQKKIRHTFFALFIPLFFILLFSCTEKSPIEKNSNVTWSADIAPIIYKNCSPCHRPGESGPFHLLSYHDAIKKAKLIKFVTQTGYMPPWPADPSYSHFIGERVLTKNEIAIIALWVDNGMQRGDSAVEPSAPTFYSGSFYRKPDLTIESVGQIKIKGNGTDVFYILKFPYEMDKDTLIDFVEFVPDQRKIIHHVNGHLISYDPNRTFNHMKGDWASIDTREKVLEVYNKMNIPYTDGKSPLYPTLTPNTVYYLPGYTPPVYPKSIGGYRMKKNGAFLLNNIHYGPSNIDTVDESKINVFFRKEKIQRPIVESQLGTFGTGKIKPDFIIPANQIKTFHTSITLTKAISLLSVNPHMHLLGEKYWAFALNPSGDTIPLIRINKWDFKWQYYYTYTKPIALTEGSQIHVYGTFNNTNKNPLNPFHPPQDITSGNGVESMKTTEEMFQFIYSYIPYQKGDENIKLDN